MLERKYIIGLIAVCILLLLVYTYYTQEESFIPVKDTISHLDGVLMDPKCNSCPKITKQTAHLRKLFTKWADNIDEIHLRSTYNTNHEQLMAYRHMLQNIKDVNHREYRKIAHVINNMKKCPCADKK